ncbi:MAG: hypothetical protein HY901_33045 [Deltaproteobacteria bacterium]|nr:hypothetical protein [Deltaproteobacteria bacterium]
MRYALLMALALTLPACDGCSSKATEPQPPPPANAAPAAPSSSHLRPRPAFALKRSQDPQQAPTEGQPALKPRFDPRMLKTSRALQRARGLQPSPEGAQTSAPSDPAATPPAGTDTQPAAAQP